MKVHQLDPNDLKHTLCRKPVEAVVTVHDGMTNMKPWEVTCANCLHIIEQQKELKNESHR